MKSRVAAEGILAELRHLLQPTVNTEPTPWRKLLKPGDWLLLVSCLCLVIVSYPLFWRGGQADRAIIKRDGQVVAELALNAPRTYTVKGVLGDTVIEIQPGRARVQSDPGPRQYCVQQGWLTRANAVALCAPNHITLQLTGTGDEHFDTLNY